ncbi:MAG: hypothetical protein MH321_06720 [Leptospiraceae bacterium]|nr:hypothetical protein [Leptospiraceae bacterium]
MADRENVKIVISAALIVIVASMGIYAFIYRDKISEMLPNWQGNRKSSERMIVGDEKNTLLDSQSPNLANAEEDKDLPSYKMDAEAKEYPEIPNLPQKEPNNNSQSMEMSDEKESKPMHSKPRMKDASSSVSSLKENPIPPEMSDTSATVYKADPMSESKIDNKKVSKNESNVIPKQKATKVTIEKPKPLNKTKSNSLATSKTKPSIKSQSVAKTKTNLTKNVQSKSSSKPSSSSNSTSISNVKSNSERIKNLETKLNVHMQDTNSRLESIERRIEKLESKLLEAK